MDQSPPDATRLFCCSEHHLAHMKPACCALIHPHALHLASKGGIYYASSASVGELFGRHPKQILRGFKVLVEKGFFKVVRKRPGESVRYRVLNHEQWARENPGKCVKKMPLLSQHAASDVKSADGSMKGNATLSGKFALTALARELTHLSGGLVAFDNRHKAALAVLLETYSTAEIEAEFKSFVQKLDTSNPNDVKYAAKDFTEKADALLHSARRRKSEKAAEERTISEMKLKLEAEGVREQDERQKARLEQEALMQEPLPK